MRILMLTSSWPLCRGDWRGGFVYDMALDLARRGHYLDVAVPRPVPTALPDAPGIDMPGHENIHVYWLPSMSSLVSGAFHGYGIETNLRRRPLSAFSIPAALIAFTLECGLIVPFADVIVSNWIMPMGLVGTYLSRMSGKPHLVIAHSAPAIGAKVPLLSSLVRSVVRSAVSVACVSGAVRDRVAGIVGADLTSRLTVRHLGIEVGPVLSRTPVDSRPVELLFVGRLTALKGCDLLIRAFRGLHGFNLCVAGDGPDRRGLQALAQLLKVDVTFTGEMDRAAVMGLMAKSDLLIIPSRRTAFGREEGLPRVIVEAWSAGLPVIASSTGGMTAVIGEYGGGELFDSDDVVGLRNCLAAIRENPARLDELRDQAMRAALSFDFVSTGAAWEDWISEACS